MKDTGTDETSTTVRGDLAAVTWTGWIPPRAQLLYHHFGNLSHWRSYRHVHSERYRAPVAPASVSVHPASSVLHRDSGGKVFEVGWDERATALLTADGQVWCTRPSHDNYRRLPSVPSRKPVRYLGGFHGKPLMAQAETTWVFDSGVWHEVLPPKELADRHTEIEFRPSRGRDIVDSDSDLGALQHELVTRLLVHCAFCDAKANPDRTRLLDGNEWVFPRRFRPDIGIYPSFATPDHHPQPDRLYSPHLLDNLLIPTSEGWIEGELDSRDLILDDRTDALRSDQTRRELVANTIARVETSLKSLARNEGHDTWGHRLDCLYAALPEKVQVALELRFAANSFTLKEIVGHGSEPPRLSEVLTFWGRSPRNQAGSMYTYIRYLDEPAIPTMFFLESIEIAEIALRQMENRASDWHLRQVAEELGWDA